MNPKKKKKISPSSDIYILKAKNKQGERKKFHLANLDDEELQWFIIDNNLRNPKVKYHKSKV